LVLFALLELLKNALLQGMETSDSSDEIMKKLGARS